MVHKMAPTVVQNDVHLDPRNFDRKDGAEVRKERQRQPLQDNDIPRILHKHLQKRAQHSEQGNVGSPGTADQEFHRIAHRSKICADVHDVSNQQQSNDTLQGPLGIMVGNVARDAAAGSPSYSPADFLDRRHERIGKEKRPGNSEAKLRASLRVGRNATWIVVGSARDETWTQHAKETRLGRKHNQTFVSVCR